MNYITVMIFILGACVGSFLNVCIYRIPVGESIIYPPSHCTNCGGSLKSRDLIPVFSYLWLRGRCRYCSTRVSWQYPLVELFTGLLFAAVFLNFGYAWETLAMWVLVSVLITAAVIDYYHQIIPNRLVLAGIIIGLPLVILQSWEALKLGIIGLLAAGLLLLLIAVISNGGMGGGDIKLGAVIGLYLGLYDAAIAFFLAFLTGAVVGLVLILAGCKGRKDVVPFGPFLALGAVITVLWGGNLSRIYWMLWF